MCSFHVLVLNLNFDFLLCVLGSVFMLLCVSVYCYVLESHVIFVQI